MIKIIAAVVLLLVAGCGMANQRPEARHKVTIRVTGLRDTGPVKMAITEAENATFEDAQTSRVITIDLLGVEPVR